MQYYGLYVIGWSSKENNSSQFLKNIPIACNQSNIRTEKLVYHGRFNP